MESRYRAVEAQRFVEDYGARYGHDLALRVYTSRLLGSDPSLVLHGGGNTSVKTRVEELLGGQTEVLCVKGSGWDLATIEPRGLPACRLAHLVRCCDAPAMTDEQMVAQLRGQLVDPEGPTPSVEALLHAFLPAKFVDHTHADAVLALVDQPGSEALVREVLGDRALFIPYVMPGFVLAKRVAEIWRARPASAGEPTCMVLDKHGIFTWGATALESYERMIACVTRAERWLEDRREGAGRVTVSAPAPELFARVGPVARGALARASGRSWIAAWRATSGMLAFCDRDDVAEVSEKGCVTPDHVIRTKGRPLVIAPSDWEDTAALTARLEGALAGYATWYRDYVRRAAAARGGVERELDPWPRVVLFPGLGALTFGNTLRDCEVVGDVFEHAAAVMDMASSLGGYEPVSELDLFDVEYWSLEQAKLRRGAAAPAPLAGKVALVTGAASGIGLATALAMLDAGAHVAMTDRNQATLAEAVTRVPARHGGSVSSVVCDVTKIGDVERAITHAAVRYGGLDVVVSNAGTASAGSLHEADGDAALRASLEVNLLGHQNVARAAARTLIAQGTGGALLFNASKSAFNQGPDFGPYAVPKAALVALMRQYAVDLGKHGIRAGAVNADRIRTELFGAGMAEARAKVRGLTVDEYFRQNLLSRETLASDVAAAFLYLAQAGATTGCVITVDGGNSAAFPR